MGLLFNRPKVLKPIEDQIASSSLSPGVKQELKLCAWSGDYALGGFAIKPAVRRSDIAKELKAAL